MLAAPTLYFLDTVTKWALGYASGGDVYIVVAASWLVWGIAWLVVALCMAALRGNLLSLDGRGATRPAIRGIQKKP